MSRVVVGLLSLLFCVFVGGTSPVWAQPSSQPSSRPSSGTKPSVALVGLDALGMDTERVSRLETLFLKELERLTGRRVPNRRDIAKLSGKLRRCDNNTKCLAEIGKALNVDLVVSGNIASLGHSHILNIKTVSSATAEEKGRVASEALRGEPDELIATIRVAAYRLLAPDELVGSVSVLSDRPGAVIEIDSKKMGTTPLDTITGISLGKHTIRVSTGEFGEFSNEIEVRFQKTTRVVVNLVDLRIKTKAHSHPSDVKSGGFVIRDAPKRWYQKTWFLVSAGIGAAVLGGYVGFKLAEITPIQCSQDPSRCQP